MTAGNWKERRKIMGKSGGDGEKGEWLANTPHVNLLL